MQEANNTEILKNQIIDFTNKVYDETGKGLLLAVLGETLGNTPIFKSILRRDKLSKIIKTQLSDSVRILESPESRIAAMAVPAKIVVDDIKKFIPKRNESKNTIFRYHPAIWAAFSKPISCGFTRLIGLRPKPHFRDVEESLAQDTSEMQVDAALIVGKEIARSVDERNSLISGNIEIWLSTNKLSNEVVGIDSGFSRFQPTFDKRGSKLESLINLLPESDLKRIQIPLDVIAKLLKS